MKKSPSIVVLIPYFGPWPFWTPAFLASCRANPGIRWELFADHPLPGPLPPNVNLELMTFAEYCELVSDRLAIRFRPEHAYKLCDMRPALAIVHPDKVGDAPFWAFSDVDLVYGDLESHYAPLMERWEIISTHRTRASGHFTVFRNSELANNAFRQAKNWRASLENPAHTCFDESGFSQRLLPHKNWPRWLRLAVYCRDPLIRKTRFKEEFTSPKEGARLPWVFGHEPLPQRWEWREGKVTADLTGDRTFPYFHFIGWKQYWAGKPHDAVWQIDEQDLAHGWYMTADGFFPLESKG